MASPFQVFRKYQKTLLAIAGVICMFVFVVGDSLMSYFGGGRNAQPSDSGDARATAVHWNGGKLSNRDLQELVTRRRILNNFIKSVEMEGRRPSFEAGVDPPALRVQPLVGADTPQQQVESSVVRSKLLADAARDAGMKVSDETLLQYLSDLGRGNVTPDTMRQMLKSAQIGGARVSSDYVLNALRDEMLAHNFRISQAFAAETVTPEQRWRDWSRVNDRVVVEAAAVPAEIYLPDVKEPTEAELTAFYEKYKNNVAGLDYELLVKYGLELPSPNPGFMIPRKVDAQFLEASYDEYLAKAEAKVTDAEVAKYYEEHKDLFPKLEGALSDEKDSKKDAAKSEAPVAKSAEAEKKTADMEKKPGEAEKKPATPAEKPSVSPEKPAPKSDAPPAPKSDTPPAPKADAPPAPKDPKPDTKSSEAKKSSFRLNTKSRVFRLTAFAEEADKKAAKDEKSAEKTTNASAPKTETPPAKPAEKAADKPAEKSAVSPPVTTPATPTAPVPPPAPGASAVPPVTAPKKPVEYQPLSEVKDEIRKRLAEGKVAEELSKIMDGVQAGLDSDYNKWRYSDAQLSGNDKQELPPPPKSLTDFTAIAQKQGLKAGTTGAKTMLEFRETPVGKSSGINANRPLLALLFQGNDLGLFEPVKTIDIDGNRFIAMKISDSPAKVPTFAEAKSEVIKAWKKQQAEVLAKKHADEFAKKAEEAKSPLASVFAENKSIKVVRTDPFSELTGGEASFVGGQVQQRPYRLSQPSEIVAPGPEFLSGAVNLKDGKVGVFFNNDHSIAYVVRAVEHQPNLAGLRAAYMADAFSWQGENLMNQEHSQKISQQIDQDLRASTKLIWDRDPDKAKGEQSDEGEG